jgi:methionyl-tRNA synthetase
VANWGNLVNRVLNMTKRYLDGVVTDPGDLTSQDKELLEVVDRGFISIGSLYDACKFRAALQETLAIATKVNQYLEESSPWTTVKSDIGATARSLYTSIQAISGLKTLFAPVLPFTGQTLHELLGENGSLFGEQLVGSYQEETLSHIALTYDGSRATGRWARSEIPAGRKLPNPKPLFKKLDQSVVETELERLSAS